MNPEDWRPFKLRSDGDLWEHFTKAVMAKGCNSVAFTWAKGHATDDHVAKGMTTTEHKFGNFSLRMPVCKYTVGISLTLPNGTITDMTFIRSLCIRLRFILLRATSYIGPLSSRRRMILQHKLLHRPSVVSITLLSATLT